jgi:hypothetical protein
MKRYLGYGMLSLSLILLLSGASAYFVDRQTSHITAKTAAVSLKTGPVTIQSFPEEILPESTVLLSLPVWNESSVPVYLKDDWSLQLFDQEEKERITLEGGAGGCRIEKGEEKLLTYTMRFPGQMTLPEGRIDVTGSINLTASTGKGLLRGFTFGPVRNPFSLTGDDALFIPFRKKDIRFTADVEPAQGFAPEIVKHYYRSSDTDIKAGPDMSWQIWNDETHIATVTSETSLILRYELDFPEGTVRSPIYSFQLIEGEVVKKQYDYLTGELEG